MGKKKRRIGLMGGTFNPIHLGHLITAEAVWETFGLDEVLFIPSAHPPHKDEHGMIGPDHRLRMTELAIQGNPHFRISDIELRRQGPSYAVDTVKKLKEIYGGDAELYFITGADAVNDLYTWYHARELLGVESSRSISENSGSPIYIDCPRRRWKYPPQTLGNVLCRGVQ